MARKYPTDLVWRHCGTLIADEAGQKITGGFDLR